MSSNIQIQKICRHCGKEFTASTTVTKYCSHKCGSARHKAGLRSAKIKATNQETLRLKNRHIEDIKTK